MLYVVPVKPWFAIPFNETGRRCLGFALVFLCLLGLVLCSSQVLMLIDIAKGMLSLRYFYPPSDHFFKPVGIALLHTIIHIAVYTWFAIACFYTSRWQTRTRFNEYISVMVFGFLVMALSEHAIFVALYNGIRKWSDNIGMLVDRPSFFYKFSDLARFNIDHLQEKYRCCGGSEPWMWHIIDWVGLDDEAFVPPEKMEQLRAFWVDNTPKEQV